MRITDTGFETDWDKETLLPKGAKILLFFHHCFSILALALIIYQSAISLNILLFTLWLIIALVMVFIDILSGQEIKLENEVGIGVLIVFGAGISVIIANADSMFFVALLERIELLVIQIFSGLFLSFRLIIAFYYNEIFSNRYSVIKAKSSYSREQLELYKMNLYETDFEFDHSSMNIQIGYWLRLSKPLIWSSLLLAFFTSLGVLYALLIYLMTPETALAQFAPRPALIILTLLLSILLFRIIKTLPEIENRYKKEREEVNQRNEIAREDSSF